MLDPIEFGKAMAAIVREVTAPLLKRIEQLEASRPERGEKGEQGAPGQDARPIEVKDIVAELLAGPEIAMLVNLHVAEGVQKHFEANPVRHGTDGAPGIPGKPGERGEKGEQGNDGIGQAGAMIDREGCLIITTTKGEAIKLGVVVGKNGENGKDGADFSEVTMDYDGDRGLIVRGKGGELKVRMPIPMDGGYYREGMTCEKGDIVTNNGDAWIALRDNKAKPCRENKEDWRLFARKGRDGIDGKDGRDLGPAPPIKLDKQHA